METNEKDKYAEVVTLFTVWLYGAIQDSHTKAIEGSIYAAGMNCAFHIVKEQLEKYSQLLCYSRRDNNGAK